MKRALFASLLLLMLAGCGGKAFDPYSMTASVTPSQATVKPGGTVVLTGTQGGSADSPIVVWFIQESKALDASNDCGKLDTQAKDFKGCPFGFVMYHDATTVPSIATYYAPQTPGTYHVVFDLSQFSWGGPWVERSATATIEVEP
jgi:hypothetical protein